jgi:hypothetical protein
MNKHSLFQTIQARSAKFTQNVHYKVKSYTYKLFSISFLIISDLCPAENTLNLNKRFNLLSSMFGKRETQSSKFTSIYN